MKLYMVESYYHVLITLCKAAIAGEQYDLYVDTRIIPSFPELEKRMQKTGLVRNIYHYDATEWRNSLPRSSAVKRILLYRHLCSSMFSSHSPLTLAEIRQYDDIYIYCASGPMENYVIQKKVPFHLLEDGLDFYSYFAKHYNFKKSDYLPGHLRYYARALAGRAHTTAYRKAIDVEVNDKSKILIPCDTVIEQPRKELFAALTDAQKQMIYDTFLTGDNITIASKNAALVFTRPMVEDRYVSNEEEQRMVVEHVIRTYAGQGYDVVIKVHPRDPMNYSDLVQKYHCGFIGRTVPSELLNFNTEMQYSVAVGLGTTAINAAEGAQKHVFLDRDAVAKILQDEKSAG